MIPYSYKNRQEYRQQWATYLKARTTLEHVYQHLLYNENQDPLISYQSRQTIADCLKICGKADEHGAQK